MQTPLPADLFDRLVTAAQAEDAAAMLSELGHELARQRHWHALFDLRLIEGRLAEGLPVFGDTGILVPEVRDAFEERSRQACLEVGWPLLDEGQVAAGWMYLRAAAETSDVAARLEAVARALEGRDDDETRRLLDELIHVSLWEAVNPPLGLRLLLAHNGTCNTVTAYDQSVSRLTPARQEPAARVLVEHLSGELRENLRHDLSRRGIEPNPAASLPQLIDAFGDATTTLGPHLDVSHLHAVLRFARVCTDASTLRQARELADYAAQLPEEVRYPGDGPFSELARASQLFYAGCLGERLDEAAAFFSSIAGVAMPADTSAERSAGSRGPLEQLAVEYLIVMLARGGRAADALDVALSSLPRAGDQVAASTGLVPPLVQLAMSARSDRPGSMQRLLDACRERGDAVTFAQALAAEATSG